MCVTEPIISKLTMQASTFLWLIAARCGQEIGNGDIPAISSGATPVPSRVTDGVQVGVEIPQQLCCGRRHDLKAGKDAFIGQHISCTSSQCAGLQQPCTSRRRAQCQHLRQQPVVRAAFRNSTPLPFAPVMIDPLFLSASPQKSQWRSRRPLCSSLLSKHQTCHVLFVSEDSLVDWVLLLQKALATGLTDPFLVRLKMCLLQS